MDSKQHRLAIFASGSGTNAENICQYFLDHSNIKIELLVCNKPKAKVIERLKKFDVEVLNISKDDFKEPSEFINILKDKKISFLVLAGFLWLLPIEVVKIYTNKIVNIHPALLPNYGGKGMYGKNVHQAVVNAKEKYSGITIHYANERYDEGAIIFQKEVELAEGETADSLAKKVLQLEYTFYPKIIEEILMKNVDK